MTAFVKCHALQLSAMASHWPPELRWCLQWQLHWKTSLHIITDVVPRSVAMTAKKRKKEKKKTRVNWPTVILGGSPSMPSCLVKHNQTYSQMHCPKLVFVFVRFVPDLFQDSSNSPRPKSVLVCSSVNVELDGFCFSFPLLTWQQCPEIEHNICSVNNWTWNPC